MMDLRTCTVNRMTRGDGATTLAADLRVDGTEDVA
jgi:hypothetical protein